MSCYETLAWALEPKYQGRNYRRGPHLHGRVWNFKQNFILYDKKGFMMTFLQNSLLKSAL